MRLQLILISLLLSSAAHAQEDEAVGSGEVHSRLLVYSDDDQTTIVTSTVDGSVALPANLDLGAHVLVDAVSTASVDVVSAATERWTETRLEAGVRGAARFRELGLGIGYVRSQENDWVSDSFRIGAGRDFFEKNTRLELSYSGVANRVGRANDPSFERRLSSHSGALNVSQLVDRKSRVALSYVVQRLSGFQSSPYRYVEADGARLPERHPERRLRQAATLSGARSLLEWLALHSSYRLYGDDWGIVSHAAILRIALEGGRFSGNLSGRFYRQGDADFYRRRYRDVLLHMSADRELSRFWDLGGVASAAVAIGPFQLDARAGYTHYRFKNFDPLAKRRAMTFGGGARAEW